MLPSRSGSWVVFTASVLVGASTYALLSLTHSYNVVAGPGALLRYRGDGALRGPLVRRLVLGTLPGVVLGAVIRVFALPGPNVFRLLVAALMLPLGTWLIIRTLRSEPPGPRRPEPVPRTVTVLALQLSPRRAESVRHAHEPAHPDRETGRPSSHSARRPCLAQARPAHLPATDQIAPVRRGRR
ncbi:hypothetical protein GCM10010317_104080 [Streptomyces mirabilis]|nr:sulfite exporter TauE/SafE family protein [Streptomyces mirabilis]GHD81161.1 hypothetical protein GCM10010317_104080 [Streptomyces mirabilis]